MTPQTTAYSFTYDAAGQRTGRTFPAGTGHSYAWYGDGQLASETRPDGNLAAITYDARGFPTVVNWSNVAPPWPGNPPVPPYTPDVNLGVGSGTHGIEGFPGSAAVAGCLV